MPIHNREDYLLRLISQIIHVMARAMGFKKAGKPEEALEVLRTAQGELLGPPGEVVSRLDSASAARIVGRPDQILAWARLLEAEAEVLRSAGDETAAAAAETRALELALEAWEREPGDDAARDLVRSLAGRVGAERLAAPQRTLLGRVGIS